MSRIRGYGPPLPGLPPVHEARIPEPAHPPRSRRRPRPGKQAAILVDKRRAAARRRRWLRKRCSVTHAMIVNLGERRVLKMIRYWPRKQMHYAFVRLMGREFTKRLRREWYYGDKRVWDR